MTITRDELVEEIAKQLEGICDPMASYHPSKGEYLRDVASTFIALTLKAVVDGDLELPGEYATRDNGVTVTQIEGTKGLYRRRGIHDDKDKWLASGREEALDDLLDIAHPVIALSPVGIPAERKEGTFLEEVVRNLEAHRKRLEEWLAKKQISPTGTGEEG